MKHMDKKPTSAAEECVEAYRSGGDETDPQGSWTGNPRANGGMFLHDAFPFVPGVFAGTELYGAEMMTDPGLISTGIFSPNEDSLINEQAKKRSGGRSADYQASEPAGFTAGIRSEMPVSDLEELSGNEMKPVQDADDL